MQVYVVQNAEILPEGIRKKFLLPTLFPVSSFQRWPPLLWSECTSSQNLYVGIPTPHVMVLEGMGFRRGLGQRVGGPVNGLVPLWNRPQRVLGPPFLGGEDSWKRLQLWTLKRVSSRKHPCWVLWTWTSQSPELVGKNKSVFYFLTFYTHLM